MKLLSVLDEIAFLSRNGKAGVVLASGARVESRYRMGDDVDPRAFHYYVDGRQVDVEEASCLLDNDSGEWRD